mmetsp:Transcript_16500/g.27963  ORF Transcript_16500/g.27963 Transcript_16500/m.27963 type:complete len:105 (+) Transcript_16500:428-742(+)
MADGSPVGLVGTPVTLEGEPEGTSTPPLVLGTALGIVDGIPVGEVGICDGVPVGAVGMEDGSPVGLVGMPVEREGEPEGTSTPPTALGTALGIRDGIPVGAVGN